jgi:hypothetical protein
MPPQIPRHHWRMHMSYRAFFWFRAVLAFVLLASCRSCGRRQNDTMLWVTSAMETG